MVKSKRNVANPNSGFYTQLKVWGNCKYDIRSPISINGARPFKDEYQVISSLNPYHYWMCTVGIGAYWDYEQERRLTANMANSSG